METDFDRDCPRVGELRVDAMSRVATLWRNLVRRDRVERDLNDELSTVLELLVEEKVRSGMSAEEARRLARLELGGVESLKEQVRDARAGARVGWLLQDLRGGWRLLRKNPTFASVAILTLALGTGANTAIFQFLNGLRLRPLPVERPTELVSIGIDQHGRPRMGRRELGRSIFSEPLWQEIRAQQEAFSSVFAWGSGRWDLSTEGEIVWADGFYVSGSFFRTLGIRARVGRLLTETDDHTGCGSAGAVLSHEFWQARYGGDVNVIGQTISVDRRQFEIIGVVQPGFLGVEAGRAFDVALPLCAEPLLRGREEGTGKRDVWWLDVMGRLKPEWTIARAGSHLAALSPSVFQSTLPPAYTFAWQRDYAAFTLTAMDGSGGVSLLPSVAISVLWMLLGATGLVLLLTCANLASLMLARATARGPEIAVRVAIGATRGRLIAQLLTESALIAGLGAMAGFLVARWISGALLAFLNSGSLPVRIVVNLTPDWRVFAVTTFVAVLACLLFGLSPAVRATRRNPAAAMQPKGRSSSEGHEAITLRRGLVVVQLALSIILIVGALLSVRTLGKLNDVDLGFDPAVLVAAINLGRTSVQPAARLQAFEDIVARLHAVPRVRYAAETVIVPLSGADWNGQIVARGEVQNGEVHFNAVGVEYFRVMQIPVVSGRTFERQDRLDALRVAVVNEAFARRYVSSGDPLGQTFQMDGPLARAYHIVGVVGNTKILQVGEGAFLPIAYLSSAQEMVPTPSTLRVVVRTDAAPPSITPALTGAITDAVPGAAVSYDAVARYLDTLLLPQRLVAWLSGFFGVLALLIASIGLYGMMSYLVTSRRSEIGIRMALGAEPGRILRLVLRESGTLVACGLGSGIVLAAVVSRLAASLLYGLTPLDPVSFALGTGVLAGVALFATWFPAYSASKVAPMVALRE